MTRARDRRGAQQGSALIVSLIMLVLMTVLVGSMFTLATTNLKSVGNTQLHDEAIAAANAAIEQVISSPFTAAPAAQAVNVDINNDGVTDYTVQVATPVCVSASAQSSTIPPPSSLTLPPVFNPAASTFYNTVWDLNAQVTDAASGASANVHQGVRVLLSQAQYTAVCP